MDAIAFLEARERMCGMGCDGCPAQFETCDINDPECDFESLVEMVERWAAEHPETETEECTDCPTCGGEGTLVGVRVDGRLHGRCTKCGVRVLV